MYRYHKQISIQGDFNKQPLLEIWKSPGQTHVKPLMLQDPDRYAGERWWMALPKFMMSKKWKFRILLDDEVIFPKGPNKYHTSYLEKVWIRNEEVYDYPPTPGIPLSPSRVMRIKGFEGSLPTRPLYVYLPRGYDDHLQRHYPLILMHDGQNCFESHVDDSFSGSWNADSAADKSIRLGLMRECIIVGVSNGNKERLWEYLPPYSTFPFEEQPALEPDLPPAVPTVGRADETLTYYRDHVIPYVQEHFRILGGRENIATCGSSLGGLFSSYIACEFPEFAKHHAIVSPSYWITANTSGELEGINRISALTGHQDLRIWLDSGTRYAPGRGDDGMYETLKARDAFLNKKFKQGKNFRYYLAQGATHHESAWAARLPLIFQFLFPLE